VVCALDRGTRYLRRYYVGLRVAEESGREYSLAELAHMPPIRVQAVLSMAISRLIQKAGGCK
jgi:hypothetical protein